MGKERVLWAVGANQAYLDRVVDLPDWLPLCPIQRLAILKARDL